MNVVHTVVNPWDYYSKGMKGKVDVLVSWSQLEWRLSLFTARVIDRSVAQSSTLSKPIGPQFINIYK